MERASNLDRPAFRCRWADVHGPVRWSRAFADLRTCERVPAERTQSGPARRSAKPLSRVEEHRRRRSLRVEHAYKAVRVHLSRRARPSLRLRGGRTHRSVSLVMPRVTAIISTYNYAPVLPFAIQSVLDQQFSDFELLVIGDRCTDESEEVVSAF